MEINSLVATFGRLENETLTLSPGLNVIEAGNESGKTTWMTFIRVMLYGLNTRDRSPLADKHRYRPWSGSPMQGRMDLSSDGTHITVTRTTSRSNSPMGAFSAHFTDTTTPIPDLTSATFGESLLGVPQDVFERSAFIRQSGIPIDQSASLERRIAALIATGEEDTSFTDAAERLRKQLTRRRYNKTGLLPQLEGELFALENTLSEISALEQTIHTLLSEHDDLTQRKSYLRHQLDLLDAADNAQRIARRNEARQALETATAHYHETAARVAQLPSRDELTALIGEFSALSSISDSVKKAVERESNLRTAMDYAQQQLNAHPFSPQTPAEAANAAVVDAPPYRFPVLPLLFAAVFSAALFVVLRILLQLPLLPVIGCAALTAAALSALIACFTVRRRRIWQTEAASKRKARQEAVDAYTALYREVEAHRAAYHAASDAHRTLVSDYHLHLDRILNSVQKFHRAENISDAQLAVQEALTLHATLDEAAQTAAQTQLRFDLLNENIPNPCPVSNESPELTRPEADRELAAVIERISDLNRRIHTAQGRCQTLGDPILFRAELEQKRAQHDTLKREYDAIALASSVLSDANTKLQSRFSPALGEKSANIFTKLTHGKYNKVLLDRKMTPSAQETGDMLSHEVTLLSQGAADQLYLAVRLAICNAVLPSEKSVPIFLDDALVTFDDDRMAAALDYLVDLSRERQILLFTCQKRELNYLRAHHAGNYHAVSLRKSAQ